MSKVFIDTDVVLDFLTGREPHSRPAAMIFNAAARGEIELCISALTVSNLFYILSRLESAAVARDRIKKLLDLVTVIPMPADLAARVMKSAFTDLEDGLQYFCAFKNDCDVILTRNVKDYKHSELAIMTPVELLKAGAGQKGGDD